MSLPDPYVLDEQGRLVGESVQRNFDALATEQQQSRIMAGVVFPAYSASSLTPTVTVAHGFGRAPVSVVATVGNGGHVAHSSGSSSVLSFFSETLTGGATTGAVGVYYIAVF